MRLKMPWNNLEDVINAQKKPNRNEIILAIKSYWLDEFNVRVRKQDHVREDDPSLIQAYYCTDWWSDWEKLEKAAKKKPSAHLLARNVIRHGIAQGYDLSQAQKLIAMLLDDAQRPKKQGRSKTVGLMRERSQICLILRFLLFKPERQPSKIKRLTYLSNPAKIMRPRCKFILPHSILVKRGLYTTATSSPSINNAFDIVATATGLSFDVVKNALKAEKLEKERWRVKMESWTVKKGN